MMNILLLMKVIPTKLIHATEHYEDSYVINPYDLFSLTKILEAKKANENIKITCMCMGAKFCLTGLYKALVMGADRAVLISDKMYSGADTYATTNVLAQYIRSEKFDLIVCGEKSVDGETGQVPYQLGEALSLDVYPSAEGIAFIDSKLITEERVSQKSTFFETPYPAIVIFKGMKINYPPIGFRQLKEKRDSQVEVITNQELNLASEYCGLSGSKTRVIKTNAPLKVKRKEARFLDKDMKENAKEIHQLISVFEGVS